MWSQYLWCKHCWFKSFICHVCVYLSRVCVCLWFKQELIELMWTEFVLITSPPSSSCPCVCVLVQNKPVMAFGLVTITLCVGYLGYLHAMKENSQELYEAVDSEGERHMRRKSSKWDWGTSHTHTHVSETQPHLVPALAHKLTSNKERVLSSAEPQRLGFIMNK